MIFPGSEEAQQEAQKPQETPEQKPQEQPAQTPQQEAPAEQAQPEQAEVQQPQPQPQQVHPLIAKVVEQDARLAAMQQQFQAVAQLLSSQLQPQAQGPAPVPQEELTPDKVWEDPVGAMRKVASDVATQMYMQNVVPAIQTYTAIEKQRADQSIINQLDALANDPRTKDLYSRYREEMTQDLANEYRRLGPLHAAQPMTIRDTFARVVGRHYFEQPQQPQQPAIAQNIPAVGAKVTAPRQTATRKVELTEDEAREARKQKLTPEEYAKYRDSVYG